MEASEETTRSILVHANGPHPLVQNSVHLERGRFMWPPPRSGTVEFCDATDSPVAAEWYWPMSGLGVLI